MSQLTKPDESEDEDEGESSGEEGESSAEEDETKAEASTKSEKPKVRTKYDRMFERKNQNILSEHFTKLVEHSDDGHSDDDFITLKRADHALENMELPEHEVTSKRKQRLALSKKALAARGPKGSKLVFDDDGNAHEIYELKSAEEAFKEDDVKAVAARFAEEERGKLKQADVVDRAVAKEKKKEKKRKRKERERAVRV